MKEHQVSLHEINNQCERIKKNIFKTEQEIADIESQTRPQSGCFSRWSGDSPSRNNPYGLIEAKNVLVQDGETLKDALVRKSVRKMSETGFKVNKNNMHLFQIQQQLFVVNRDWGVLAILGSKGEFFNEEIAFEPEWREEKLNNIETFYEKFIIYELAYPRIKDGLTRCDFN